MEEPQQLPLGSEGQQQDNDGVEIDAKGIGSDSPTSQPAYPKDEASLYSSTALDDNEAEFSQPIITMQERLRQSSPTAQQQGPEAMRSKDESVDESGPGGLGERLSWAQAELVKRTCAFNDMKAAYDQVKVLLDHSMHQIERLSTEIVSLNAKADSAQDEAAKHAAAAEAARRETAAVSSELLQSKQQLAETKKALTKAESAAQAKVHHTKQVTVDIQDMEDMRIQLAAAVRKMAGAIEAKGAAEERAAAAEAAKMAAEAARMEAERLRREAQAEAQAAIAAAEAERSTRAEAEGMSEALKQESERRARVFNAAVKAAVGRLQQELEEDREELQGHLTACQELLEGTRQQLHQALEAAEAAQAESAERSRQAETAAAQAAESLAAAERARTGEAEARSAAQAAESTRAAAVTTAEEAESRCQSLEQELQAAREARESVQAQLKTLQQTSGAHITKLMSEKEVMQEKLEVVMQSLKAAEQQSEQKGQAGRAALEKAQRDAVMAKQQVQQLEQELKQLRTSKNVASMFTLPSTEDVLAGLGLELMGNNQIQWKAEDADVEVGPVAQATKTIASKAGSLLVATSKQRYVGAVPLRMMFLIAYLVILHIAVMVSFTRGGADVAQMTKCERLIASGALTLPPR